MSILSYGSVWAMHSHDDGLNHEQTISTVDSYVTGRQHTLDDDHFSHASAHLIGLFRTRIISMLPVNHMVVFDYNFISSPIALTPRKIQSSVNS